jgi:hypothetical protein
MTIVEDDGWISETVPEYVVVEDTCLVVSIVSAFAIRGIVAPMAAIDNTAARLVSALVFIGFSSFVLKHIGAGRVADPKPREDFRFFATATRAHGAGCFTVGCFPDTQKEDPMRFPKALIAAFVVATFSLAACHERRHEGPAETAGEKIDKGMSKMGEKMEEGGRKLQDKARGE